MAFKENVRLEHIYFSNLKKTIKALTEWKQTETAAEISDILNSCIESNEAILLLYKNVGECWNDLSSFIAADRAKLEELAAVVSSEKDEINAKIDDVNNYLVSRITALETRVAEAENQLDTVEGYVSEHVLLKKLRVKNSAGSLSLVDYYNEELVYGYEDISAMIEANVFPVCFYIDDTDPGFIEALNFSCFDEGDGYIVFSTLNFGNGGLFHYEVRVDINGVAVHKTMIQQA